ncbi:MAG: hypothetical protein E1N59_315 [Puniceicoccaceae bacterium 5H]|nr:MAG: hypothetical protein E1N59_315 [Puniceicoccaceae bacterium 5H]
MKQENQTNQPTVPQQLGMYLHVEAAFSSACLIETTDRQTKRPTGFQVLVSQEFLTDPGMCEVREYIDVQDPRVDVDLALFKTDPVAAVKRYPALQKGRRYLMRVGSGKAIDGKWRFSRAQVMWEEQDHLAATPTKANAV